MDQATLDRLYKLVANPPPGSKIAAAKEYGIDLTLTVRNLSLTPTERLDNMKAVSDFLETLRAAKKIA